MAKADVLDCACPVHCACPLRGRPAHIYHNIAGRALHRRADPRLRVDEVAAPRVDL